MSTVTIRRPDADTTQILVNSHPVLTVSNFDDDGRRAGAPSAAYAAEVTAERVGRALAAEVTKEPASGTIRPGQWVRWLLTTGELAPLAKWRRLEDVVPGDPHWMVTLVFADGFRASVHVANLVIVDAEDVLWQVSDTEPEEAL